MYSSLFYFFHINNTTKTLMSLLSFVIIVRLVEGLEDDARRLHSFVVFLGVVGLVEVLVVDFPLPGHKVPIGGGRKGSEEAGLEDVLLEVLDVMATQNRLRQFGNGTGHFDDG